MLFSHKKAVNKLKEAFYLQPDVVQIARNLIGKVLVTQIDNLTTSGIITETEAYAGATDKASHAYQNLRTARTETMFAQGACAYIYLCYGMHHLFNIVTNVENIPHAVLIRSIYPLEGWETMLKRRKRKASKSTLCNGPAKLSQALGITTKLDKTSLLGNTIWIEDRGIRITPEKIKATPRIGVDYADEDALLKYRFITNYSEYGI